LIAARAARVAEGAVTAEGVAAGVVAEAGAAGAATNTTITKEGTKEGTVAAEAATGGETATAIRDSEAMNKLTNVSSRGGISSNRIMRKDGERGNFEL
jgi:hypothetical protein